MDIPVHSKFAKLFINLASNIDLTWPYLKANFLSKKLPIDLEMPWWSFRAMQRADSELVGKRIFEYGTGGSTIRYAGIAESIKCVEDDPCWADLVMQHLRELHKNNVEIVVHPFDFDHPIDFDISEYANEVKKHPEVDVVIIDGQDKTFNERVTLFDLVEPQMRADGIIILDDFWRYEKRIRSGLAKRLEVFESVGPCRYGVTSTAFFYY